MSRYSHPNKCCHFKYSEPTIYDECRCGLGVNNGIVQVMLSQMFLFAGLWFSAATIGDCDLVLLDEPIVVREDNVTATSIGIISYRDAEFDSCYYWSDSIDSIDLIGDNVTDSDLEITGDDQILYYLREVLGNDWYVAIGFFGVTFVVSVFFFLYSTSYYCSTQVRGCRNFVALTVGFLLPLFQALGTFFVFQSEWCDIAGCTMGRGTIFSIIAGSCFFCSGVFYAFMENWPGTKTLEDMEKRRTWATDPNDKPRRISRSNRKAREDKEDAEAAGGTGSASSDEPPAPLDWAPPKKKYAPGESATDHYHDEHDSGDLITGSDGDDEISNSNDMDTDAAVGPTKEPSGVMDEGSESNVAIHRSSTHAGVNESSSHYDD